MAFASPSILWALLAVAIPLIIHLFDLQRSQKVFFTNVKLLKKVEEKTTSTRKIKHLLVLLSRILFIVYLVLAFAQPFIQSKETNTAKSNSVAVLYFDNSLSLQNTFQKGTLLDKMVSDVIDFMKVIPNEEQFFTLSNSSFNTPPSPKTKTEVAEIVNEIRFSSQSKNLEQVLKKSKEIANGNQYKLFIFSDLQKDFIRNYQKIQPDSNSTLFFVPIQNTSSPNVFVDSIWFENNFIKSGENVKLNVGLANTSETEKINVKVKLFVDGIQSASGSYELQVSQITNAIFDLKIDKNEVKKCVIEIEDGSLKFDNKYYFTILPGSEISILEISDLKRDFLGSVYSNESSFLLKKNKSGSMSFKDIQNADLMLVEDFDILSENELQQIYSQVKNGKSVLFFPSENCSESALNIFSNIFKIHGISKIEGKSGSLTLKQPEIKNPFFESVFEKIEKNTDMPSATPLLNLGNKGLTILTLANLQAYLTQFNLGKSKVYISASPLKDSFTNLHKHAIFVPLMYKIAMNSGKTVTKPSYTFDSEQVIVNIPENTSTNSLLELKGEKKNLIPEQRKSEKLITFSIPKIELESGFYDVYLKDSIIASIALNYPKNESKTVVYKNEELSKIFENNRNIIIAQANDIEGFTSDYRLNYLTTPLWKYFLISALIFLFIEILLIRYLK
jgi:hypothetical protein